MNDGEKDFSKLHELYQPRVFRYLVRLVGTHEAEDLTQEVFMKVSQALSTYRGESQLSTWIYRIATNVAMDRLRSPSFQRTARIRLPDDSDPGGEGAIEDKDPWTGERPPSVEATLIREEMNKCIRNFIENLPPDYRTVVVLSELEEFKDNEIAQILGITIETAKVRLHRARVKLRKELEAHCSFYHNERNQLACDLKTAIKEFRRVN